MFQRSSWIAGFALAAMTMVGVSSAQAESYTVDPNHQGVVFEIEHLRISKVFGKFTKLTGTVEYDPKNVEASKFDLTVEAASIDTGNANRDKHLRSADFFNVEKFPTITFKSTKVTRDGDDKDELKVTGELTLLGVTKTVTIELEVKGPAAKGQYGFTGDIDINRTDYGMKYGVPMIGDKVELDISFEVLQAKAE